MKKLKPLMVATSYWAIFILGLMILLPALGPMVPSVINKYITTGTLGSLIALGLILAYLRFEKKTLKDIALVWDSKSLPLFVIGLVVGLVLCLLMYLVLAAISPLTITMVAQPDFLRSLGLAFLILCGLALMEELAYRSFPFLKLQSQVGMRTAIYVSSISFALYHGLDVMNFIGPGVWGIYYGLMAIWSRGIALPFGFHVGLNWLQTLFGAKPHYAEGLWVMGQESGKGILTLESAGLGLQVILLLIGVALVEWTVRRGQSITPIEDLTPNPDLRLRTT